MKLKKIIIIGLLVLIFVSCANNAFNTANSSMDSNMTETDKKEKKLKDEKEKKLKDEKEKNLKNEKEKKLKNEKEKKLKDEKEKKLKDEKEKKLKDEKEKKLCKKIRYQNQAYIDDIKLYTYTDEKYSGREILLERGHNREIELNILEHKIKDDCREQAENKKRVFGFENQDGLCICAYGELRRNR